MGTISRMDAVKYPLTLCLVVQRGILRSLQLTALRKVTINTPFANKKTRMAIKVGLAAEMASLVGEYLQATELADAVVLFVLCSPDKVAMRLCLIQFEFSEKRALNRAGHHIVTTYDLLRKDAHDATAQPKF